MSFPFNIAIADKKANCEGLQLADLTARAIGLSVGEAGTTEPGLRCSETENCSAALVATPFTAMV